MAEGNGIKFLALGEIWKIVSVFFVSMFSSVWSDFVDNVETITFRAANAITKWMKETEITQWGAMLDIFVKAG